MYLSHSDNNSRTFTPKQKRPERGIFVCFEQLSGKMEDYLCNPTIAYLSYQNVPEGTSGLTTNIRRGVSKIATTFIYVVNSIILQQEYNDV